MEYLAAFAGIANLFLNVVNTVNGFIKQGMAEDAAKRAAAEAYGLEVPDIEEILKYYKDLPERPDVQPSDQRAAQLDALRQLSEMGSRGGMDEGSIAAVQQAISKTQQANQQARDAIEAEMQRAGRWGMGQELASKLAAAQGSANALSMAGTQAAADARMRALEAIARAGGLATNIRGQDEELALANKAAKEARDRYNAEIRDKAANWYLKRYGMQSDRASRILQAARNYADILTGRDKGQEGLEKTGNAAMSFLGMLGSME